MSPRLFWALITCIPLPLVLLYAFQLWSYEHYRFFPMLIAAVAFLLYQRWDRICHYPKTKTSNGLIVVGLATLIFAVVAWSPWTAYLAWLILFSSFCLSHFEKGDIRPGEKGIGNLFYLTIPCWLCLRLPLGLDENIPIALQHLTAKFSSFCLDQISIPHHLTGVIFDLPKGKLFIEEACSGIQSVFTLACISLLLLTYYRRPIVLLPIYLMSAIFSASLMNVVRIVIIAVAQEWYGFDLAHGWLHDLLGYCCLLLAMLLLASFDKLFQVLFFPIRDNALPIRVGTGKNPLQIAWNFFLSPKKQNRHESSLPQAKPFLPPVVYYTIFMTLVGYQLTFASPELVRSVANSFSSKSSGSPEDEGWKLGGDKRIWNTPQNLFENIPSLEVTNYENKVDGLDVSKGQFADIWNVKPKSGEAIYRLAISQPYNRFHDLTTCYTGVGWNIVQDRILTPPASSSSDTWPIKYSSWETPDGMYGYLTYSGITKNGDPVILEENSLAKTFSRRFGFNRSVNLMDSECLMFQIWVTSTLPLSQEQVDSIIKLHFDLEVHVLKQMRQDIAK